MEDRCWVIHYAKGIDCGAELLFLESRPNVIGKARPYEEHLLASLYPKPRVLNINNGSEFHPIFNFQSSIFNLQSSQSTSADLQTRCRECHLHKSGILILLMIA